MVWFYYVLSILLPHHIHHHGISTYAHVYSQLSKKIQITLIERCVERIRTPITDLFKINHPVLLAGMSVAAGPKLAAAVTNAGGLGVIGGVRYTTEMLRDQIAILKDNLIDKNAPFGIDLLLPQVGGNARKTKLVTSVLFGCVAAIHK